MASVDRAPVQFRNTNIEYRLAERTRITYSVGRTAARDLERYYALLEFETPVLLDPYAAVVLASVVENTPRLLEGLRAYDWPIKLEWYFLTNSSDAVGWRTLIDSLLRATEAQRYAMMDKAERAVVLTESGIKLRAALERVGLTCKS